MWLFSTVPTPKWQKQKHVQFSRHFNRKLHSGCIFDRIFTHSHVVAKSVWPYFSSADHKGWIGGHLKHKEFNNLHCIFLWVPKIKKVIHVCNNTRLRKWQMFIFGLDWHINCQRFMHSIVWKRAVLFFLFNKRYIKLIKSDSKVYAMK